ncbi:hypothetical protein pb186bvf_001806 [Paramecium bursaria]
MFIFILYSINSKYQFSLNFFSLRSWRQIHQYKPIIIEQFPFTYNFLRLDGHQNFLFMDLPNYFIYGLKNTTKSLFIFTTINFQTKINYSFR